eukprot:GEMP01097026.1.p1 GENE.GEMP01097026.1~~GEMP01097026.1.p1  ORF type:complete len:203 (+),score=58.74 GEMP01097026.1:70-678(+)
MDFGECLNVLAHHQENDDHKHGSAKCEHPELEAVDTEPLLAALPCLRPSLPSMDDASFAKTPVRRVVQVHRERVRMAKAFDEALAYAIEKQELGAYPVVVQYVTSQFQHLSAAMLKAIEKLPPVLQKTTKDLQQHEKRRLELQAALHMEKINLIHATCAGREAERRFAHGDMTTHKAALQKLCEDIEEIMSDLAYEAEEEDA